jgi:hypothetical protein
MGMYMHFQTYMIFLISEEEGKEFTTWTATISFYTC